MEGPLSRTPLHVIGSRGSIEASSEHCLSASHGVDRGRVDESSSRPSAATLLSLDLPELPNFRTGTVSRASCSLPAVPNVCS